MPFVKGNAVRRFSVQLDDETTEIVDRLLDFGFNKLKQRRPTTCRIVRRALKLLDAHIRRLQIGTSQEIQTALATEKQEWKESKMKAGNTVTREQ